ncbi:GATA transcription factor 8 [Galdieria sulphuraria]|nr:GATA transcription factor 8 [Galdieria sulphuraria]
MIERLRCVVCGVTDTPLWRSGPKGPKTLCNACGVRWKKGKLYIDGKQASPPVTTRLIEKVTHKQARAHRLTSIKSQVQSHYFPYQGSSTVQDGESETSKYEAFLKTPTAAAIAYAASKSFRNSCRNRVVVTKEENEVNKKVIDEQDDDEKRSCWYLSGLYSESDNELEGSPVLIELDADSLPAEERGSFRKESSVWTQRYRGKANKWSSIFKKDTARPFCRRRKDTKSIRRQTEYKFRLLLDAAKAVGMEV